MCPSISQRGIFLPWARTIQRKAQYSHVVEYYAAKEMAILEPRCIMGNGHVVT